MKPSSVGRNRTRDLPRGRRPGRNDEHRPAASRTPQSPADRLRKKRIRTDRSTPGTPGAPQKNEHRVTRYPKLRVTEWMP